MQERKSQLKILELLDDYTIWKRNAEEFRKLMHDKPQFDEDKIVSYLESGTQLFATLLAIYDDFGEAEKFVGGPSIVTDGVWFWRSYLPYFVKTYHFRLPPEFVEHAKGNDWKVPNIPYEQEKPLIAHYRELRHLRGDKF